ncbi:glycerophosphodiester phosphodiesterase family protein [Anaerofustis sp. NSJ-163]|uniref:glycerophosphodiester phosphodiesterase family protein n=1 Tax=Anaerofustis sp. NSJ-163 TaxID=2944391 RepID=UPI00209C28C0|nr:glycerophosphodiester phosphodiesterase family protein [Anaerofustis sp. NSJ-163]MCO8193049.1 hypothetical protein [Anaerofustis sp. NSJ-163]
MENILKILFVSIIVIVVCMLFFYNYKKKNALNFLKRGIMAHSCGEIDGIHYTNSKEAFENTINKGIKLIEVDFSFTSDNKIVALHPYHKKIYETLGLGYLKKGQLLSYKKFKKIKICDKYTTMDFDDVMSLLKKYKDIYVLIDISKDLDIETTEKMYKIITQKLLKKRLIKRVVVQAGSIDMFETIEKIYDFPIKQFYIQRKRYENNELDEILEYMDTHNGFVTVGCHKGYANEDFANEVHKHGYYFNTFPINDLEEAEKLFKMNVDYICTDDLNYDEINKLREELGN